MITKNKIQKKKKSKKDIVFQTFFLILTLSFIGFLAFSSFKINKKRAELTEKIESLKEEIEFLEKEKEQFEAGISQTEKESYWEERVREEGYVKEGENPVVIIPLTGAQEEELEKTQGFSQRLLEKIKSLLARVIQW
ncbi:MAG: septum formation initiator family protein [Candidatus Nealsonbacteria bacterium]|nr:MAG: septum formation initiator family protein [Candidatus Nealsonbacteria bacterium]